MSEYARIGEGWVFWQKYGTEIQALDASLVTPVLQSLGASIIRPKWLSDINAYRCGLGGEEFDIVFDLPDEVSNIVEIIVSRRRNYEKTEVGHICVHLPCDNWAALQEQLRTLLETSEELERHGV